MSCHITALPVYGQCSFLSGCSIAAAVPVIPSRLLSRGGRVADLLESLRCLDFYFLDFGFLLVLVWFTVYCNISCDHSLPDPSLQKNREPVSGKMDLSLAGSMCPYAARCNYYNLQVCEQPLAMAETKEKGHLCACACLPFKDTKSRWSV